MCVCVFVRPDPAAGSRERRNTHKRARPKNSKPASRAIFASAIASASRLTRVPQGGETACEVAGSRGGARGGSENECSVSGASDRPPTITPPKLSVPGGRKLYSWVSIKWKVENQQKEEFSSVNYEFYP